MKILALSAWFPYPLDNGSRIRVYHILRELARSHEVSLLSFDNDGRGAAGMAEMRRFCRLVEVVPAIPFNPARMRAVFGLLSPQPRSIVDTRNPAMAALVAEHLGRRPYDLVVASQLSTAHYVPAGVPCPACFEEVEVQVIKDQLTEAGRVARLRNRLTWLKLTHFLRALLTRFELCTTVSPQEEANVRQISPASRVHVVPNGVDLVGCRPGLAAPVRGRLIYAGSLTFDANFDAVSHFLSEIYPRIQARIPDVEFVVTGSVEGVQLDRLPVRSGVRYAGCLPDVRPAVAGAWASVVPLRIGGGTRLKVLESMALGTPVVATSKGAEGLRVTPGENILVADDPEDFAEQTVRLLKDSDLRVRLAESGRRLVEERYGWEAIGRDFENLLKSVCQGSAVEPNQSAVHPFETAPRRPEQQIAPGDAR